MIAYEHDFCELVIALSVWKGEDEILTGIDAKDNLVKVVQLTSP